jgi:ACS family hexuronate transporter-like MFS transporter
MIVWWSAANFCTGLVGSVTGLGIFRFLLGMGEGGGFPGSGKAVAEWFPPKERAMAFGIFNTGSAIGAVAAPPLISWIVQAHGWRWVFFITGAAGFIWAAIWLKFYQPPAKSTFVSHAEREFIRASQASACGPPSNASGLIPWFRLLGYRQVLGLMAAKFLTDSAWYFFIFWLPKYLGEVRHLNIKQIGYFAWIPFAFAGLGSLSGGWLSSYLIRRNVSLDHARKIALGFSALLLPASLFIVASPLSLAIVFFSLAMFAHQFWSANVQTLPADIFPSQVVGSVEGLLGSAGSFGGMLFGLLAGRLIGEHGYGPAFIIASVLHPIGFLIILFVVRKIEPVARYERL